MLHTSLIQLSLICSYLLKSFLKYKMYFLRVLRVLRFCYAFTDPNSFWGFRETGPRPLKGALGMQWGAMRGGYIVAVLQHAFLNYFTGKTTKMYFVIKDLLLRILQLEQLSERICSINIRENKNKIQ